MHNNENRKPNRFKKAAAGFAILGLGLIAAFGGTQAGWVDDFTLRTPGQASGLEFTVDGNELAIISPFNESAATNGIAPGDYASSPFTPMMISSDDATMRTDVTVEVSNAGATPFPGLEYAIVPGNTTKAEYALVDFQPLVDGTVTNWYSVPNLSGQPMTNVTPDDFTNTVNGAGGQFKVVFKADSNLVEGSTFDPQFRFVATQLADLA